MDRGPLITSPPPAQKSRSDSPPQTDVQAPEFIPDHRLLQRIGQGSYGEVWLARHTMGMYRAVKIVYRKSFEDHRPFERELLGIQKFEPVSRSHEGFVDVLHVGINEAQGCFYYVMELADDEHSGQQINPERYSPKTLAKATGPGATLPVQECLELGLALSLALAELHKDGLVHRDVKPSNIIFVNGVPKLADLGLVAGVDEARSYVGTTGFIPPEGPGTPQADVYSLGKVLYEASTGRDRQDFPELPTHWDAFPDHDKFLELNEVILHACKPDPRARYRSAWEMHADLVALANGKSVKRLKLLERRFSLLKRTGVTAGSVLAILAVCSYPVYRAQKLSLESRQRQAGANIAYGTRAVDLADPLGALPHFAGAMQLDQDSLNQADHQLRFGSVLAQCPKLAHIWFAPSYVCNAVFSPDGREVLAVERAGKMQLFDLDTDQAVSPRFGRQFLFLNCAFNHDGTLLVAASQDWAARVLHASDGAVVFVLPHPDLVLSARFSPDSSRIVTGCADNLVRVWNAQTRQCELVLTGHAAPVIFAAFSPDGRKIVTTSRDSTVRVWDAADGHLIGRPLVHPTWVRYASFSPDGQRLVTACFDRKARVWDLTTETLQPILPELTHPDIVGSAEFSPDGRLIATACFDHTARLWLAEDHQPFLPVSILRHSDRVTDAAFHPDGHRLVTACEDGTVRVWDLAGSAFAPRQVREPFSEDKSRFLTSTNGEIKVWQALSGRPVSPSITPAWQLQAAKLSRHGDFILLTAALVERSGASNRLVEVWQADAGKRIGPALSVPNALTNLCLSDNGQCLLAYGGRIAQTWDVRAGTPLATATIHSMKIQSAAFSPAGDKVASWAGLAVRVWDPATGRELFGPLNHPSPVTGAAFSPDGGQLVSCCADPDLTKCPAQVWNAATGQPVGPKLYHGDGILFASFSHDGKRVVTTGEDYVAIVWEVASGKQLTPALKHEQPVKAAAFSPDDKWVVTASEDKTARVWNATTGDPLTPPLRHPGRLTGATFLGDGCCIVTSDQGGKVWIWELPVDQRPVQDLVSLARLLAGDMDDFSGGLLRSRPEAIESAWRRLRAKYPADFATSVGQIAAWHESQAQVSELEGQWAAAAFHLGRLSSLQPSNHSYADLVARANGHLAEKPR